MLGCALLYAGCYLTAEELYGEGLSSPADFQVKHDLIARAALTFPFDERFQKGAARLDFYVAPYLDPEIGMADTLRALQTDPFAPDMLNGLVYFAARAERGDIAAYALQILRTTEPGFVPGYLQAAP